MKIRKDEWICAIGFCAFIGIMAALYLLLPKSEFSETEKRYLAETPNLTLDSLTSGDFGEDVDTYMADHIPGRDFLVGLNAYVDLYTGRQVSKDIYVAEGDRLVEAPVQWDQAQAQKNVTAVNSFAKSIGKTVHFMIVPSAGWAVKDSVIGIADPYNDAALIDRLYGMTDEGVSNVDVVTVFENAEDKAALYYKTDHHWTSLGAYTAYAALMEQLNRACPARDFFTVRTVDGFKGSTHSRAALWLKPGEPLEMWEGSKNLLVTNGENDQVHEGIFYEERLQEADKYTVYLDGNHSVVCIENPDNAGKGKVLVIRDSYSNCLGGFLAESYETVVLVDLRYLNNQTVSDMEAQYGFDDVLVCYSLSNFLSDNNLFKLK